MSDSKKPPQPFSKSLFSSPGGSSSLSFGLDEPFNSPFSLAPAQTSKPDEHDAGTSLAVQTTSTQQVKSTQGATPPSRQSPVTTRRSKSPQQVVSAASTSSAELSTVPLDSPTTASTITTPSVSTSGVLRSSTAPAGGSGVLTEGGTNKYGWNDPPMLRSYAQTPSRPVQSTSAPAQGSPALNASLDEQFQIQPLAGLQKEPSPVPPTGHPPVASVSPLPNQGQGPPPPPAQDKTAASSNPYRYGAGFGTSKLAYGSSGIASFGGSSGAPPTSSQPMMVPSQLFEPPPPSTTAASGPVGTQPAQPPPSNQGVVQPMPVAPMTQPAPYSAPPMATPLATDQSATGGGWNAQAPVRHHWFYLRSGEKYWIPFSLVDSNRLEEALINCSHDTQQQVLVPTDGGRYDVDLHHRSRHSVYWEEPVSWVRRCSWFFKGETDRWYLPYDEMTAHKLEEEYLSNMRSGMWNKQVQLGGGEYVVMHSHSAIVHYPSSQRGGLNIEEESSHPKSVLRGFAEIDKVETGEQSRIDHLVFVVHGIGAHHDLNFRSLVDCVDDFREVAQLMLKTHTFSAQAPQGGDGGGRVEFLPVHWHTALHGDDTGVDSRLKPLTLPSITRLRDFTNSTLLDILYFTSPIYCQTIISQVASEMNRMWELFQSRNPSFQGNVSLIGHSLGACVLFDLLDHQQDSPAPPGEPQGIPNTDTSAQEVANESTAEAPPPAPPGLEGGEDALDQSQHTIEQALSELGLSEFSGAFKKEQIDFDSLLMCTADDLKEIGVPLGPRKKLISYIAQQEEAQRVAKERREQEAMRRLAKEKEQQREKDHKEAVDAALERLTLQGVKIVKGLAGTGQPFIEYPQLKFPTQHLFALGSPIGLFLTVRGVEELGPKFSLPTCSNVFNIFHPFDPVAYRMEPLVTDVVPEKPVLMPHHKGRKRFHLELYENLGQVGASIKHHLVEGMRNMWQQLNEFARSHSSSYTGEQAMEPTDTESEAPSIAESADEMWVIGELNQGRRVDYVLQEKPIEKLNEYLFALSSHLCYWRSEDTALFILKEVYNEPNPRLIKS